MFLTLQDPVPVLPGLWSSCSPFPVELTAWSFLLPSTSLLFYHSTHTVFPLDSVSFAFPAQLRPPFAESLYLTTLGLLQPVLWVLQVISWIRLNGWLPRSLFLHLHFEKDLPVMSAQKSCKESWIPSPSLCPLCLCCCCYGKLGCGYWGSSLTSVPSGVRPQLSQMIGSGSWAKS